MTRDDLRQAELVARLRGPLARIELVTGELARQLPNPRAASLLEQLSEAAADLDRQISETIAVTNSSASADADLWPELWELYMRLSPVLAAQGIEWELPRQPAAVVRGEPAKLRQLSVCALRAASLEPFDGTLRLELLDRGSHYGLAIECSGSQTDRGLPSASVDQLGRLTERLGGSSECGRGAVLRLWLPRQELPCDES